ncbi:hypothetical protein E2C01_061249 [Portunus trituberculatus]|uniref:Homeobox domain-containing protein n=1 Tax=Portunus trituberculatus TaxID=210409 RepID=A0A5B7HEI9_PORTR|nr:hypothetical protein [Portunus trituberculatus]
MLWWRAWLAHTLTAAFSPQVWFQNARAKWRRQMVSKDPKALSGGDGGLSEGQQGESSAGEYPNTPSVPPSAMSPEEGNSSQISYQQMF